ncbi:MAG: hypothetical protein CVU90_02785 [Firmicutes bacterium HGW-Firmicutes-15]|nr:MAG: hypothetical protein CVU90_02785 [Firmicutes bacterium HGW-Firmicutes-15]
MKHFDVQEWLLFNQGEAGEEKEHLMEEHLVICEDCMQIFLDGIDEIEINRANAIITPDFTTRTIELVKEQSERLNYLKQPSLQSYQHKDRWRRRLFSYYVAAAAVTLMLMSGGVFQSAIHQVPNISIPYSLEVPDKKHNLIFTWPTQLREKTTGWIGSIELKNSKEVK